MNQATRNRELDSLLGDDARNSNVKAAIYCRFAEFEDASSDACLELIDRYEKFIKSHAGWVCTGIYIDTVLYPRTRKQSAEFRSMVEDAQEGKFNLLLTQSMCRFAGNLVDSAGIAREFNDMSRPVNILFEDEGLYVKNREYEFMLMLMQVILDNEKRTRKMATRATHYGFKSRNEVSEVK